MAAGVSKSRFTKYVACPRLGYLSCYPNRFKHLADPLDWMAHHLIAEGVRVGELARERFPGGRLVGHVWDLDRARAETTLAMRDETVTHLFEAAFAAGGLLCRVDILLKAGEGEVDLIEVKAANGVRPDHLVDVGFQLAVLEATGLTVRTAAVMHLDPGYVYPGEGDASQGSSGQGWGGDAAGVHRYDLDRLFVIEDVTSEARAWAADSLPAYLESMRADLDLADPPRAVLRYACKECEYYRRVCGPALPLYPAYELGGGGGLLAALDSAGIQDMRDVPWDFPGLVEGHRLVLEAVRTGGLAFDRAMLESLMSSLEFPLWFLDFETFMPGLPLYAGTRPWQQIPFQWSLHVLEAGGVLRHEGFLRADGSDPRRAFAETLLQTVSPAGSVVVYNKGMECTRLRELARDFPDLEDGLSALDARVFDLLPVVRQGCYHPDFHGSRSLKSVTPVLAPHLSYEQLQLRGGLQAMQAYERLVSPGTPEPERVQLQADLRAYCGLDTLAMVEVYRRLLAATMES